MKLELVFLTLVAGAMAANPQPCCVANKFSAVMFSLGATVKMGNPVPVLKDTYIYLNYDYDNQMVAMETHALNMTTGRRDKVNIYQMFSPMVNKVYVATEDGHCHWHDMNSTGLERPCIPANFSYAASFKVGYHDHALLTHTFAGMADKMMTRWTVTTDDCSPVAEAGVGMNEDGNFNINSRMYADVKQNYNTVGAFVMPSICNNAMEWHGGHNKRDLEEMFDVPLKPSFLQ